MRFGADGFGVFEVQARKRKFTTCVIKLLRYYTSVFGSKIMQFIMKLNQVNGDFGIIQVSVLQPGLDITSNSLEFK